MPWHCCDIEIEPPGQDRADKGQAGTPDLNGGIMKR
jgi:hypothetical protein